MKAKNYFRKFINLLDGGDGDIQNISFSKFMAIGLSAMVGALLISCVG